MVFVHVGIQSKSWRLFDFSLYVFANCHCPLACQLHFSLRLVQMCLTDSGPVCWGGYSDSKYNSCNDNEL